MRQNDDKRVLADPFVTAVGKEMEVLGYAPGDAKVGVALSGGADSVALTAALREIGFDVVALHCNFHLRGEESDGDESYCRDFCQMLGVALMTEDVDIRSLRRGGESIEMACRRVRYDWFDRVAEEQSLSAVAIAHHLEDQVETLLLNLFRGTGVAGLRGMRPQRGRYVRPMLGLTRADVENYLKSRKLSYRVDSSNLSCDYKRNVVRNEILPLILSHFPDAVRGFMTTSSNAAEIELSLDYAARKLADASGVVDGIEVEWFGNNAELLVRTSRHVFSPGISHRVAEQIIGHDSRHPGLFQTVDGDVLEYYRGRLSKYRRTISGETVVVPISSQGVVVNGISIDLISQEEFGRERFDANTIFLDSAILKESDSVTLRHPAPSDRMIPFGMKGSRLVSDILKEAGLPPSKREAVWLMTVGDRILWVVGVRSSCHFPVTEKTGSVLRLRVTDQVR